MARKHSDPREKLDKYFDETEFVKRIYWKLIKNGDEVNIAEFLKLIEREETRAYIDENAKTRSLKSFLIKYGKLFSLSRKQDKGNPVIRPVVNIEFCKTFDSKQGCLVKNCSRLHVCRHFIKGKCTFGMKCKKPHHFDALQTRRMLKEHYLEGLNHTELKEFLCRNVQFALEDVIDATNIPKQLEICKYYNVAIGCSREEQCPFLHVCRFFAEEGTCKFGTKCIRSHDFNNHHSQFLLNRYKIQQNDVLLYLRIKREESIKTSCVEESSPSLRYSSLTNVKQPDPKPRSHSLGNDKQQEIGKLFSALPVRKMSDPLYTEMPRKLEICDNVFKSACQNRQHCMKLHRKLPFSWEYSLRGEVWEELSKQENLKLERAFCNANQDDSVVKLNHKQEFIFKFSNWIAYQTKDNDFFQEIPNFTPFILTIRRLSTASAITRNHSSDDTQFLTTWIWYHKDDLNNWQSYDDDDDNNNDDENDPYKTKGQPTLCSNTIELAYQLLGRKTLKFQKDAREFVIDFERMIQEDVKTNRVYEVRRRPLEIKNFYDEKHLKRESLSQEKSFFPSYWNFGYESRIPCDNCELIDLETNSDEYSNIYINFISSMPHCRIHWIKAVQNPQLWMKYAMKRESLKEQVFGTAEEMYLYRSVDLSNVDKICISGFGYDIFDTQTIAVLRESCCFSKEARKANRGNKPNQNGCYCMFLCRVLINSNVTRIPHDEKTPLKTKETKDPSIFYVFEYDNIFPEFLIMFTL